VLLSQPRHIVLLPLSRQLTSDEMRALQHTKGEPWFTSHVNNYGTELLSERDPNPHSAARPRDSRVVRGRPQPASTPTF
jgi:hypothetical protein